ncbi:MAG: queuosine precursor transporter, partial [Nitrospinota bacterium]
LVIASVLAAKIISFLGLYIPAGVLAYSITFIVTDVVSELWGRERARGVVLSGFIALLLAYLLIRAALSWSPAPFWQGEEAFGTILGATGRIILASLVAYLVSQYHDVWAFHLWRRVTSGRFLWLRNNLSTAASQLIDTTIFITLAFYGTMPIGALILGQYLAKLTIALLDTPVVYALVYFLRREGLVPEAAPVPISREVSGRP